jgi:hypothetical protein
MRLAKSPCADRTTQQREQGQNSCFGSWYTEGNIFRPLLFFNIGPKVGSIQRPINDPENRAKVSRQRESVPARNNNCAKKYEGADKCFRICVCTVEHLRSEIKWLWPHFLQMAE